MFVVRGHFEKACFIGVFKRFRIVVPHLIFPISVSRLLTSVYEVLRLLRIPHSRTTIRISFSDPFDT